MFSLKGNISLAVCLLNKYFSFHHYFFPLFCRLAILQICFTSVELSLVLVSYPGLLVNFTFLRYVSKILNSWHKI
jgi:hypothetical protein